MNAREGKWKRIRKSGWVLPIYRRMVIHRIKYKSLEEEQTLPRMALDSQSFIWKSTKLDLDFLSNTKINPRWIKGLKNM